MLRNLKNACKNWWLFLILGIICIMCSIAVFCTLTAGVATLAVILMISLMLAGILGVVFVISNRKEIPSWGWNLILPIIIFIVGIILACFPQASAMLIICLFGVGVLFKSIETVCYAISVSKIQGSGWGWTLAAGIVGILLSILLFANPIITGIAINIFVGIALLFMGIESIAMSVQMSKVKGQIRKAEENAEE